MNKFTFDLQRFAAPTWSSSNGGRTWTCQVQVDSSNIRTYTVTSTVALTSVVGDPQDINPSNSVTLTGSSDLSNATVSISANSGIMDLAAFKFVYGDTLYRAATAGTNGQISNQRLISRNISAGDTLTLNSGQDFFRVVNGTTYTDYSISNGGGATLTINSDGTTPQLDVPSGSSAAYLYPTNTPVILISGSLKSFQHANHTITLGEGGITWTPQFSDGALYSIDSTVTKNTDGSTSINLTSYNYYGDTTSITNGGPITFSAGAISYKTAAVADSNSSVDLTVKDGKTYIHDVSTGDTASISGKNFTLDSGTITLIADNNDSSKFYITDLDKGDKFTLDDVSYTMGGTLLVARYTDSGGTEHILIGNVSQDTQDGLVTDGEVSSDALDVNNSWLLEEIHEINGALTINNSLIGKLTNKNSLAIVKTFDHVNEDPDESYGSFTRATDADGITTYSLRGVDSSKSGNLKYSAVTIEDNLSIQLNQYLTDVPITVNSTTFTSRDNTDFTYATTSSGLSLSSASVSLISGSLHSDSNQSIGAGLYSVSGYNGDFDIARASSLSSSDVIISDIDTNESFQLSTASGLANYTLLSAGNLLFESAGSNRRVYNFGQPSGNTGISANLASLNSSVNGALVIAPNNRLLEIGSTNKSDAVVFNDTDNPTSLYASLDANGSNFTLSSLSGAANFHSAVDSISISAGNASIYKSLVSDGVTIITPNTTFLVSDSDSAFFSIDATASSPSINGASNITLLSGKLTATAGQSITLGSGGRTLKLGDSSDSVTISLSGSTFSVNTNSTASFTFNNRPFTVTAGNGISLDISGTDVTLRALDTGDQFSYDSTSYSITGGGFMKGTPPNDCALWIANSSSYSLANNSVSVADMTNASNWGDLILVSNDKITLYPASNNSGVLMSDDFTNTYGRVEKNGDDSYLLTANDNDGGSLKEIFIENGTRKSTLTANADNFLNVSIASNASTLLVSAANNDTFQVTVDGAARESGLLGSDIEAVLYNGSLSANSSIASITVGDQVLHSDQPVTVLTDGSSGGGSISGLEGGNSFRVDGTNYTFTKAGLRNGSGDQLRRGTKIASETTAMPLSLVSGTSDWVNMIGTSSISGASISSNYPHEGFLVDTFSRTVNPTKLYGEVASISGGGFALTTLTNGDAWEDGYTINVDETTVSIDSAFASASINAVRSGATFLVDTGESSFIVTDRRTGGALLGGAEGITQTAGLVAAGDSGLESVTVADTTVYKTGGLELNVSVSGGEATLSSLDEDES
ncbi:MAG: hypothetical protein SR2Q5_05775, partial [Quinella sp. 2Q5]|nr:hypothetical protein [Quinella sp. 2Q5]